MIQIQTNKETGDERYQVVLIIQHEIRIGMVKKQERLLWIGFQKSHEEKPIVNPFRH
jgi:hypothetical protein